MSLYKPFLASSRSCLILSFIFILDDQSDPLQLRQQALTGACPLLQSVTRVPNWRIIDFVTFYVVELHFFAIEVFFVLDHVLGDEKIDSLQ